MEKPGCMGRNEGRIQNSGGIGLLPIHSNTPSIYNKGKMHTRVNYQQTVIMHSESNMTRFMKHGHTESQVFPQEGMCVTPP